jgi:aspartate kinase
MTIIIQKFGGTSLAGTNKIMAAAQKVATAIQDGCKPIVIVSAMAGATNQLISYCLEISDIATLEQKAEYDAVLSSGENITAALMSLTLNKMGFKAQSLQGWQIPIRTNNNYGNSSIVKIENKILLNLLDQNIIPVIAGFQGLSLEGKITTLGRGGSDITAVAISAALSAQRCDIYTDVNGVFTADPRFVPEARKRNSITYEDMLEFSILGAKVLHHRAVEIAMRYNVLTRILSSFENSSGTIIARNFNEGSLMEKIKITGIAHNDKIALIRIENTNSSVKNNIINALLKAKINIVSIVSFDQDFSLIISLTDLTNVKVIFDNNQTSYIVNTNLAFVSLVGIGINNDLQILSIITNLVTDMNYLNVATTKISFLIDLNSLEGTIKLLHGGLSDYL